MKISYKWLQKYFKEPLPTPAEISEGIIFHAFEVESVEEFNNDTIFEIKILPDRAHDCLSHWGIAKEISAIFGIKINPTEENNSSSSTDILGDNLKIQIEDSKCRRYMGKIIRNIKVGPSPLWLSDSLVSIGQKSINNIVDATNYVMFDLGNPIHAFDLDKLEKDNEGNFLIKVRPGIEGEKIVTLDKKEVNLNDTILVIADAKNPLAIAGIKGGNKAEVDNNTKNIVIEVANFDPTMVRKTSHKLGIFTDSAKRFENEISEDLASLVMDKITDLILEIAGGECGQVVDIYKNKKEEITASVSSAYLNRLLGLDISDAKIEDIFNKFQYKYEIKNNEFIVSIPSVRLDLVYPYDLAEEIGRIYGYEKIKPVIPEIIFDKDDDAIWKEMQKARAILINTGYSEVMNYTFTNEGVVEVLVSASDKNFLRTNLKDGMKKSYELNKLNLSILSLDEIKIFEIGTIFIEEKEEVHICYANKKEIKEMKLDEFIITSKELSDVSLLDNFKDFRLSNKFIPWSVYPFITRDIAVWIPAEKSNDILVEIYKECGGDLLINEPRMFDRFTKGDMTSYAYRLVFQSYERTLKDEEVTEIMSKINSKILDLGFEAR